MGQDTAVESANAVRRRARAANAGPFPQGAPGLVQYHETFTRLASR
jgi:hypothetical protein